MKTLYANGYCPIYAEGHTQLSSRCTDDLPTKQSAGWLLQSSHTYIKIQRVALNRIYALRATRCIHIIRKNIFSVKGDFKQKIIEVMEA